jgi:hypothetical protein
MPASGFPLIYAPADPACQCVLARDVSGRHPHVRIQCPPCGQEFVGGEPVPIVDCEPDKAWPR